MQFGAIILCGGQSSRMGTPKAWLPLGDQLMLPWIASRFDGIASPIVVVAAPNQDLPPLPAHVKTVHDEQPAQGPLQGIAAGLDALENDCDAAYISSCDVPFLQPAFITRMFALLGPHDIAVPHVEDRYHPLAAVYRVSVLAAALRLIGENRMRPMFLFQECKTRIVTREELTDADPDLQSLRNLNTPEDYQKALSDWR